MSLNMFDALNNEIWYNKNFNKVPIGTYESKNPEYLKKQYPNRKENKKK